MRTDLTEESKANIMTSLVMQRSMLRIESILTKNKGK